MMMMPRPLDNSTSGSSLVARAKTPSTSKPLP